MVVHGQAGKYSMLHEVAATGYPYGLVDEKSPLHSPTFKKAKEKRMLVLRPVNDSYLASSRV